ncbi:uncharacterized protein [Malus domestica]|uniref:uncharacterized protein n=1 Tax=Malus domestica TaxID=3750 RepID=UPI0010AB026F|nr:uncharacterized protein LOC114821424 [Malus domestica]
MEMLKEVIVPDVDRPRYRTRKGHIATNVLGVCTHDLKFVYVLSGWEGSATASRVLGDAVTRANGLKVPTGKIDKMYMAVDPEENARLAFDELPIMEDLPEILAYIETVESSQTWTQWKDDLAREIYDEWKGMRA